MNYAQIRQYDIANGVGIRTTLFVSGCKFKCNGCFNQEYQDFNYGNKFTKETEELIITYLSNPNISGLSILGGEPLQQDDTLLNFIKRVKTETNKSIWLWTGYVYENLTSKQLYLVNNYIDILVDGQFIEELKDMRLKFRGSSNQRIIDIKKTLKENKVILWQ